LRSWAGGIHALALFNTQANLRFALCLGWKKRQKPLDNNNDSYYYLSMNERKYSSKREEIFNLLKSTKTHPGARWVYDQLKGKIPGLSLATVYRNMNVFLEEKKVISLGVVKGEERFDGFAEPHPHLVCSHCGAVIDLPPKKAAKFLKSDLYPEDSFVIDYNKTVFY
jgi:Fur family peroxide stress response transcriptional regulator